MGHSQRKQKLEAGDGKDGNKESKKQNKKKPE